MKSELGIPKKKHPIRRIFGIVAGVMGVAAAAGVAVVAFTANPLFAIIDVALISAGVGAITGLVVGGIAAGTAMAIKHYKKESNKTLNQIREYNKERTSSISKTGVEAKVCRKHFNANLKLCKLFGGSLFGTLHGLTGNRTVKQTLIANQIDQYEGLMALAQTEAERQKYAKKISTLSSKLINQDTVSNRRWTQSYDKVVRGVEILDRRTEIFCMTEESKQEFISLAGEPYGETSNVGSNIVIRYPEDSSLKPTFASIEDTTKESAALNILLKDIVNACEDKDEQQINRMFPITVETRHIDRDTTKITGVSSRTYNSLNEVGVALGINNDKSQDRQV